VENWHTITGDSHCSYAPTVQRPASDLLLLDPLCVLLLLLLLLLRLACVR
jgi:hypothetical protein